MAPKTDNWQSVKCLLCYLKQTICFGLQIYHSHTHSLQAFLEVDWVGYRDDRHSISDCLICCIFFWMLI